MTELDSDQLNSWQAIYSGKVRELYRSDDFPGELLVVATDRVSAFDHILKPEIPGKGKVLTALSLWWFDLLSAFPNHLVEKMPEKLEAQGLPDAIRDRAMLVRKLDMFPIECVVRGYLAGSAWAEYRETGRVGEFELPGGLEFGDKLPEPIYTPAFKAPVGQHDENISFDRTIQLVGADAALDLRRLSLDIYSRAASICEERGLILADTKFEFGSDADGVIRLADEVLTSDSSRYWDLKLWRSGDRKESFDKQLVRNWLSENWNKEGEPPVLPAEIVQLTADRYRELFERVTGRPLN